ncbi:hypothetical protein KUA23_13940 [Pseudomonas pergaminensis]|uniref:Antitoxin component YwqK of the YwqJK toxin-antitoxin module n=1 Tax=Pseudomonas pergaminensis TaxID=2853159 RepID=A0ABD7TQ85_9PSED|nr:hypothetical protein [Pseudomonas pergaminensis]USW03722.1 hypothetical protein KUA23_13940 [Pseudomonas pergaminensis]
MNGIKLGLFAVFLGTALVGCGSDTLDWDNARISGGKIYSGKDNKPFSGYVTNAPMKTLINGPETDLLGLHFRNVEPANRQETLPTPSLICDVGASEGLRDGKIACRSNSGLVRLEGEFNKGLASGKWTIYDSKGRLSLSAAFNDGKFDGRLEIYNPSGQGKLLSQGYKKGTLDGTDDRWQGNGTQVFSTVWNNGKENGLHREWWDYGKLKMEVTFIDGKQDGLATFFNDDNSVSRTVAPFQGEYARITRYNSTGETELYDLDRSGIQHPVVPSRKSNNIQNIATAGDCSDQWMNAYREEMGEEAMVRHDQIAEWEQWCAEGKTP